MTSNKLSDPSKPSNASITSDASITSSASEVMDVTDASITSDASNQQSPKRNALVHGIYATDCVLPWEAADEFEAVHSGLRADWMPEGPTEEETVLTLTRLHWVKRRITKMEQIRFRKSPLAAELNNYGSKPWIEILNAVKPDPTSSSAGHSAAKKALTTLKSMSANLEPLSIGRNNFSAEGIETARLQIVQLEELLNRAIIPSLPGEATSGVGRDFEQFYDLAFFEQLMRVEATIEGRIEKCLSRLITIKEYKRLVRPKDTTTLLPNSPPTSPQPTAESA